jgi:hypothetical protein
MTKCHVILLLVSRLFLMVRKIARSRSSTSPLVTIKQKEHRNAEWLIKLLNRQALKRLRRMEAPLKPVTLVSSHPITFPRQPQYLTTSQNPQQKQYQAPRHPPPNVHAAAPPKQIQRSHSSPAPNAKLSATVRGTARRKIGNCTRKSAPRLHKSMHRMRILNRLLRGRRRRRVIGEGCRSGSLTRDSLSLLEELRK